MEEKNIIVLNYAPPELAVGQQISIRAMQIGTTNFNGQRIELYDYGTPHFVAVVVTNNTPTGSIKQLPSAQSTQRYYLVKAGDSLATIAREHGTTVQAIEAANNLSSTRIYVNEVLIIP